MRKPPTVAAALVAITLLAACTDNTANSADGTGDGAGEAGGTVAVDSSADACDLSAAEAPSGPVSFQVTNSGSQVTEFYLLAEDGQRIVGEVENIGPGLTRQLVVNAEPGSYVTACKPGMRGDGIRGDFTVTDSGQEVAVDVEDPGLVTEAEKNYKAYVADQADQLLVRTRRFVELYKAGEDDAARALYPVAREHWERIETVAESFGDLDPKLDAREADLEPGQRWTGWHRIEKDLWPQRAVDYTPLTDAERAEYADDMLATTRTLVRRIATLKLTVDQIANGSRGLLEEVAVGKVTGEEEYWSRTDLYDFQANVDGARVGYEGVRPILQAKDPDLAASLDERFAALQTLLDQHRQGDGFVGYDDLSQAEIRQLSDAVNALSEPLSNLTGAILS